MAFAAAVSGETRCRRERIFAGLLFVIVALGFVFSLWSSAPYALAKDVRWVTFALWILAAILGVVMTLRREKPTSDDGNHV
jgi:prepilin signal peptidase PulO-like enzyme (type II secretory pathway)